MGLVSGIKTVTQRQAQRGQVHEASAHSVYGQYGEKVAAAHLALAKIAFYPNRIIPHPDPQKHKKGYYLEIDFLVLGANTVYCIEVKSFKGKLTHPIVSRIEEIQKKFLFFKWKKKITVSEPDKTKIVIDKLSRNGQDVFHKEIENPIGKTRYFADILKRYLTNKDKRFKDIEFVPILAFNNELSDPSAIISEEDGLLSIQGLADYITAREGRKAKKSDWLVKALSSLKTWDRIFSKNDSEANSVYGVLNSESVFLQDVKGNPVEVQFKDMNELVIQPGSVLSTKDKVRISLKNGKTLELFNQDDSIELNSFGEVQTHHLTAIKRVIVGTK